MNNAAMSASPNEWEAMKPEDLQTARASPDLTRQCKDFLGWTVLGLIELCRGADVVRHGERWDEIENRLFKRLTRPDDDCLINAGNMCVGAIEVGVRTGTTAAGNIDVTPMTCPNGLPYAAPCNGPDALSCMRERLATIIVPLYRRL
jgi:hypothetical protein